MNLNFRSFYSVPVWTVAAILVTGIYGQSVPPSQPVPQPALPNPPSNVTATATSDSEITLSWTASPVSGVTYNVYESPTSGFQPSAASLVSSGIAGTTFTQEGLQPATTYYFIVSTEGETFAPQVSATTTYPPQVPRNPDPSAPHGFSCQVSYSVSSQWQTGFTAALSITATGAPVTGWNLTWTWLGNQQITQSWNSMFTQNGNGVSLSNANWNGALQTGVTLSGIGFNASYSGANLAPASFSLNSTPCTSTGTSNPPAPPTNLSASVLYGPEIDLSWTASATPGVTYNVYSSTDAQFSPSPSSRIATGLTATQFPNEFLALGTYYYYVVTAVNAYGESAPSNVASGLTHTAPANLPAGPSLSATVVSSGEIDLSWVDDMGGTGVTYVIYASTNPNFTPSATTRIAANILTATFQDEGLTAATTYYFVITRLVAGAESQPSNLVSATTQNSLVSACHVTYVDQSDWSQGFTGNISITNTGSTPIQNWVLTWSFAGNQQIYSAWNTTAAQAGMNVSMGSEGYNATIAPGTTLAGIGFNANYSGVNAAPAVFALNGVTCQ